MRHYRVKMERVTTHRCVFKPLLVALSFILLSMAAKGAIEKREYVITVAGFDIGEMVATCETNDYDLTRKYTLRSTVSFWLFVRIHVEYSVTSEYVASHLITSTVITKSNKGDFKSTIRWSQDHYKVHVDGYKYKNDVSIGDTIQYNSARMYFELPMHPNRNILADNYGVMVQTENLQENVYGVTVEGNRNKFFFRGGKVVRAVMHHPIKNFEVTLKP